MLNRFRKAYWHVRSEVQDRSTSLSGALHKKAAFRRAMMRLLEQSPPSVEHLEAVFPDLIYGWGNEDWSAQDEFLTSCSQYALKGDGPVLECGSGLSTIVLGVIAQKTGNAVWSLEHNAEWGMKVARVLKRYAIRSVHLCVNPLKDYDDFAWYDPPLAAMPPRFSTVICDGPPGETKGGRVGLLSIMRSRLKPGTNILLDDSARTSEQRIAARWASELRTDYKVLGSKKPCILITIPNATLPA